MNMGRRETGIIMGKVRITVEMGVDTITMEGNIPEWLGRDMVKGPIMRVAERAAKAATAMVTVEKAVTEETGTGTTTDTKAETSVRGSCPECGGAMYHSTSCMIGSAGGRP